MAITDGGCFLHLHFIFDPGMRLWSKSHLSLCTVLWFKSQSSPGVHDLLDENVLKFALQEGTWEAPAIEGYSVHGIRLELV